MSFIISLLFFGGAGGNRTHKILPYRRILSPLRLPVPPQPLYSAFYLMKKICQGEKLKSINYNLLNEY